MESFDELTARIFSFRQDYVGMFGRAGDDWTADISFTHPQKCRAVISYSVFLSDKALFWPASYGLDSHDITVYWTLSLDSSAYRHL